MKPTPPDSYMLRNLHDVQIPDHVSWFPQTIGWHILLAVILLAVLIIYAAYRGYRSVQYWWQNRYRKEAHEALLRVSESDPNWPFQLLKIVKAVMVYLDSNNAALYGVKLLTKMDSYGSSSLSLSQNVDLQGWLACVENSKLEAPELNIIRDQLIQWVNNHQVAGEHE